MDARCVSDSRVLLCRLAWTLRPHISFCLFVFSLFLLLQIVEIQRKNSPVGSSFLQCRAVFTESVRTHLLSHKQP